MNDSTERDTIREDRLPDVRPVRATGNYTTFSGPGPRESTQQQRSPQAEEPAWWEVDEVASLPDARRWRTGSIVTSHLPVALRMAIDSGDQRRGASNANRAASDDLETVLGSSRYGPEVVVPIWTDADTGRERASWKDQPATDSSERRQKRSKRNRQNRRNDGRRDPDSR